MAKIYKEGAATPGIYPNGRGVKSSKLGTNSRYSSRDSDEEGKIKHCSWCDGEDLERSKKWPSMCKACAKKYNLYTMYRCYERNGTITDKQKAKLKELVAHYKAQEYRCLNIPKDLR